MDGPDDIIVSSLLFLEIHINLFCHEFPMRWLLCYVFRNFPEERPLMYFLCNGSCSLVPCCKQVFCNRNAL